MDRTLFDKEHELFRDAIRALIEKELVPHHDVWDRAGIVDRSLFKTVASSGFVGMAAPEAFGGGGVEDFRYNVVIAEEVQRAGVNASAMGWLLENDVCVPYFLSHCNDEQKSRWLPGICAGELVTAVAMTEPGTGSDLASITTTAVLHGEHYVVNGSKTFITNGLNADLVITAVKTDPNARHAGMSLLILERGMKGFERGRNLEKLGLHAQDTAELFFNDVAVPVVNRLGDEGAGFQYLVGKLPQERLSIAVTAVAAAHVAFEQTLAYTKDRSAFGQRIGSFQHSRFKLAEMATEIAIAQTFVDRCVLALNDRSLSPEEAAMAKWWCTELQNRVIDTCLQLHGGYGYMLEYPIARAYADARVSTIYGGTTEIMKEIVGRSLGV